MKRRNLKSKQEVLRATRDERDREGECRFTRPHLIVVNRLIECKYRCTRRIGWQEINMRFIIQVGHYLKEEVTVETWNPLERNTISHSRSLLWRWWQTPFLCIHLQFGPPHVLIAMEVGRNMFRLRGPTLYRTIADCPFVVGHLLDSVWQLGEKWMQFVIKTFTIRELVRRAQLKGD